MEEEFQSLQENKTWELVPLPPKRKLVQCKWVFQTKIAADGSDLKHKARLVAKGYSQVHSIDYTETFAPVAKMDSIRLVLAMAASKGWEVHHMYVKSNFLNRELQEEIYMKHPEFFQEYPSLVCMLKHCTDSSKPPGLGMQKWMLFCSLLVSLDENQTLMCICKNMMVFCRLFFFMFMTSSL